MTTYSDAEGTFQVRKVFDPRTMGVREELVRIGDPVDVSPIEETVDDAAEEAEAAHAENEADKPKGLVARTKARARNASKKKKQD